MPRPGPALFRKTYPTATIERRRTRGHETYYLVREKPQAYMPFADGKTPSEAWRKACEKAGLVAAPKKG